MQRIANIAAAIAKTAVKGINARTKAPIIPVATAVDIVPFLLTSIGIIGIETMVAKFDTAIQIPIMPSDAPNRMAYQVGSSCTKTPKPKPVNAKIMENFAILDQELTPEKYDLFHRVSCGVATLLAANIFSWPPFLRSLTNNTGIIDTAAIPNMIKYDSKCAALSL
jgi:hypothetical protein